MRHIRHSQLGIALLLILTMIIVGAASMILYKLNHVNFQTTNQDKTVQALAQAKDALIGFAMTYAEHHPGQPQGYLPCPDTDGDGSADPPCGGTSGVSVLGRLPWKTLGLPVLRDGSGECLWYAVSGNYKDNPKQTLTSDTPSSYGLFVVKFVVKDATGAIIAGTTVDQVIAIIFAPGRKIGTQHREATGNRTVCGSDNAADTINQATNYLDSLLVKDNATSPPLLIDNATSPPSQFVSAAVIKQASDPNQLTFNDTLMLITPKDFEPVYKRMNRWVANQVERCLVKYSNQYQNLFMDKYEGTYRVKRSSDIDKYVQKRIAKYKEDYQQQYGTDPSSTDIANKENLYRQNAIVVTDKYPWASQLDNTVPPVPPNYSDDSEQRFGRIPAAPLTNTHSDNPVGNPDMSISWPEYSPTGIPGISPLSCGTPICFDENQSTTGCTVNCVTKCPNVCNNYCNGDSDCRAECLHDCQAECTPSGRKDKSWYWWWWAEWKEMVFYAVENNNSPTTPTYMWIQGEDDLTAEKLPSLTSSLPSLTPSTIPSNTLRLDNSYVQIVVLVAGRKLSTQTREPNASELNVADPRGNIVNYLEDLNNKFTPGTEKFVSKPSSTNTPFNDVVCSDNTCPLP